MTLIRISPDGREVLHLYDDKIHEVTSKTCDTTVTRASDVFYDNDLGKWKVRFIDTGLLLPVAFKSREEAIEYEKEFLEEYMRLREGA
jgi:hypothetical protein